MALTDTQKDIIRKKHMVANELLTLVSGALNILHDATRYSTPTEVTDPNGDPVVVPAFDPNEETFDGAKMVNRAKAQALARTAQLYAFLQDLPDLPE